MTTLMALAGAVAQRDEDLAQNLGEIDLLFEQELIRINKDLVTKVDHYSYRIEELILKSAFLAQKAQELKDAQARIDKHVENMKHTVHVAMDLMGKKEIVGSTTRFTLKRSSTPKVLIPDSDQLPTEFKNTKIDITPNRKLIAETLKKGEEVPGARLEYGEYLSIGVINNLTK